MLVETLAGKLLKLAKTGEKHASTAGNGC